MLDYTPLDVHYAINNHLSTNVGRVMIEIPLNPQSHSNALLIQWDIHIREGTSLRSIIKLVPK